MKNIMNFNLDDTLYQYSAKDSSFFNQRIFTEFYLQAFEASSKFISKFLKSPNQYKNHRYLNYFSREELEKRLSRIKKYLDKDWCATWLRFGEINNEQYLIDANFCLNRICPTCLKRRSIIEQEKLSNKLALSLKKHPKANFLFLTLAIQNCSILNLRDTLKKINQAKAILFGTAGGASRKSGIAKIINKHLIGYISYTEISKGFFRYNDNNDIIEDDLGFLFDCHPHLHILLFMNKDYHSENYDDFIPQNSELEKFQHYFNPGWVQLWAIALEKAGFTQDFLPTANIEKVDKNNDGSINKKAIKEIAKYSMKRGDFLPNISKTSMNNNHYLTHSICEQSLLSHDALFLSELAYQLHDYRGISCGGIFRSSHSNSDDKEDLINISKKIDKKQAQDLVSFRWESRNSEKIKKHYIC